MITTIDTNYLKDLIYYEYGRGGGFHIVQARLDDIGLFSYWQQYGKKNQENPSLEVEEEARQIVTEDLIREFEEFIKKLEI